jgi:hypothetical protein
MACIRPDNIHAHARAEDTFRLTIITELLLFPPCNSKIFWRLIDEVALVFVLALSVVPSFPVFLFVAGALDSTGPAPFPLARRQPAALLLPLLLVVTSVG